MKASATASFAARAGIRVAVLFLAAGLPGRALAADPSAPGTPGGDLESVLERLAAKADQYNRYALGFTCQESVIKSSYNAEQGSFRKRDREVYDYLFERSEATGRLQEVREITEENGRPVRRGTRDLSLEIPPSYAWSQIFARQNRGKFQYRLAGRMLKGYRLLLQIDFVGIAAEPGKADIAGWSGRASVDSGSLNLYLIEAEPSGQAARIDAERLKYQRAFAIMGVPLASRPRSRQLTVLFGLDNEGLTYPAETTVAKSVYVKSAELGLEEKVQLRYRSYRFFKVGTQEEEARDKPAADPNAPPPPPADPPPAAAPPDPNRPG
jgi:hypothetical protein